MDSYFKFRILISNSLLWLVLFSVLLIDLSASELEKYKLFSNYGFYKSINNIKIGPSILSISGQLRLRYEHFDGFGLKGYNPSEEDDLLLERIRIDFSFQHSTQKFLFIQMQDAHAFLTHYRDKDFPDSNPIEDTLDVRQLYIQWLNIKESPFGFRIGRQEISYGDQRVFGPGQWGNTGRYAWDAIMMKINTKWFDNDLWVGKYLTYKSDEWINKPVKNFFTIVNYTRLKNLPLMLDVFYVYMKDKRRSSTLGGMNELNLNSIGFQMETYILKELFNFGLTFALQVGNYANEDVYAYGGNVKCVLSLPINYDAKIGVQFTSGSGDKELLDNKYGTFDGIYGGRDISFYGYLNLFFWANIREYEINFNISASKRVNLFAQYNYFALSQAKDAWYKTSLKICRRDISGNSGNFLGQEIDMRIIIKLAEQIQLMLGGGRFYPGDFVRKTGAASKASWFFLQLSITI